ncbi:MAG: thermosome subunit beta, partial [Thermofilaceae archaeon]
MAAIGQIGGVPVLILKEGSTRQTGREAISLNIMVARAIAETIKTTLGPKGMDKMLIDTLGDITISNDGATILDEMDVQHPIAKLMVEVSKAQDKEVGDGTTTAVVLTGELLKEAEKLLDKNIHPTIIASGYKKALEKAQEVIRAKAIKVSLDDEETLKKVAMTAMRSKAVAALRDYFADIAVKAVKQVAEYVDGEVRVDVDNIQIIKKRGGSFLDTQLVYGIVVDKEVVHPAMPKRVENARIALLDAPLEIEKTEIDAEIRISSPEQMHQFLEEEERILREMVEKIKEAGANVVFCQKGVDDVAQYYLARAGILAVRRVKKSDMEKLARATGARILTRVEDITPEALGTAKLVEERKVADEKMVFVEGCPNPKSVTILIRGGADHIVDEAERAIHDALSVVRNVIREPAVVAGGGAVEIEVAMRLRDFARTLPSKEQLAVLRYADALEGLVSILAQNSGAEPIDVLAELKRLHAKGEKWAGINAYTGKVEDMWKANVLEPALVKKQG